MIKRSISYVFRASLVLGLSVLVACAPPVKVVVEERKVLTVRQQSEKIGGQLVRIVQSGDTLHAIAFASNLDVNELAAWNGISDTGRLLVGQRVRLTKPIGFVAKPATSNRVATAKSKLTTSSKNSPAISKRPVANLPTGNTSTQTKSSGSKHARTTSLKQSKVDSQNNVKVTWSWPFRGKVIRRFSPASTQQGVDILGSNGQAVRASAPGEVVYVGNSLKGYGNLIIIKHNETFLSAYAHNKKILVVEGQKIAPKQVIGSVGINNRRESALHFQIRRKGKPVNPLSYLSKHVK